MAKAKSGVSPIVYIVGAAAVGTAGYFGYKALTKNEALPTPPPDTKPGPTNDTTPTPANDLPDFAKWNVPWPLAPGIDSAALQKMQPATAANIAFVIRLVQQRLMDLGYLKISATTGQFLEQTKQALIDFKVSLGIPASEPNIEKIGPTTLTALFKSSNAIYSEVYQKLDTFYKSKNETIPSGLKGPQVGQRVITTKPTSTYIIANGIATPLDSVEAYTLLGTFVGQTDNGWVGFEPFEHTGKVLYVAQWAVEIGS